MVGIGKFGADKDSGDFKGLSGLIEFSVVVLEIYHQVFIILILELHLSLSPIVKIDLDEILMIYSVHIVLFVIRNFQDIRANAFGFLRNG